MDYEQEYLDKNKTLHQEDVERKLSEIESVVPRDKTFSQLLDYGCGAGFLTSALASSPHIHAKQVLGADISHAVISRAQRNYPNIPFVLCEALTTGDLEKTDCLVLVDVLEHLPNPYDLAILKGPSKGHLIIRVPLERNIIAQFLNAIGLKVWAQLEEQYGHIHHFAVKDVSKLCAHYGYRIKVYKTFPLPKINSQAFYILQMIAWHLLPSDIYAKIFGGFIAAFAEKEH